MKKIVILLALVTSLFLTACQKKEAANAVRVGVIAGPEAELMDTAKAVAEKQYGLNVEVVEFSDYTMPNAALAAGSIDANAFQHLPYLEAAMKAHDYQLTPIAKTFLYPMAAYSQKIKNISELRDHAIVAIQNDPSNEARALLLLEKANLIKLRPGVTSTATVADIISNPKQLVIKEVDAAQIPRVLPDVDLATINTNYSAQLGLSPTENGLIVEDVDSPYTNLIVVRTADKNDPRFAKLVAAYQSPQVVQKAKELFHGGAIPGWKSKD